MGGADREDPVVTYTRLPADDGARREPRLTSGRRPARLSAKDDIIDIEALPEVAAPASDDLDASAFIDDVAPPVRKKRRAGRLMFFVGFGAILAGAGVLAATFSGVTNQVNVPVVAANEEAVPSLDAGAVPDAGRADVRVVSSLNLNGTSVSAEGAVTPTETGQTSASVIAPAAPMATPPLPRLRPDTATASAASPAFPQPVAAAPAFEPGFVAPQPAPAVAPVLDPELDQVMANVDQILAGQRAAAPAAVAPAGTVAQPRVIQPQPQVYGAQTYGQGVVTHNEIYGPPAPPVYGQSQVVYGEQPVYGPPQPVYPAPVAQEEPSGFGANWLPQRRVFVTDGPIPPADIPAGGAY